MDMATQNPGSSSNTPREEPASERSPDQPPSRPWRIEGLPKRNPPKAGMRWTRMAFLVAGYVLLFSMLTVQDRLSGPHAITYTEFKTQVANKNVTQVFARGDSIEGQLKED